MKRMRGGPRLPRMTFDPAVLRRAAPFLAMGIALAGCVALTVLVLLPGWQEVITQEDAVIVARQELEARKANAELMERTLNEELDRVRAANEATTDLLLTRQQATDVLNGLYAQAQAGGVEVVDLRAQPTPQQENGEAPYQVRGMRLRATGGLAPLLALLTRVQQAGPPSAVLIENLKVTEGSPAGEMTADIVLFTSSAAEGSAAEAAPSSTLEAPGEAGSAAPPADDGAALVRPSGWPAEWGWPGEPDGDPATPEAPVPPAAGEGIHEVAAGDTLYSLAIRYGVTLADLQAANGLADDRITIGQRLRIPPR